MGLVHILVLCYVAAKVCTIEGIATRSDSYSHSKQISVGPLTTNMITRGWDLVKEVAERGGFTEHGGFISPLGLFYSLALMLHGTGKGSSIHGEISTYLCGKGAENCEKDALSELEKLLPDMTEAAADGGGELAGLHSLWHKPGYTLQEDFVRRMQERLKVTFGEAASADLINSWSHNLTHGLVPDLVDPEAYWQLVFTSVVYTRLPWEVPFASEQGGWLPFWNREEVRQKAYLIHWWLQNARIKVHKDGVYKAARLDHKRGAFYTVLTRPTEMVSTFDVMNLGLELVDYAGAEGWHNVPSATLAVPPFKITSRVDLKDHLPYLGVREPFMPGADFSRMTEHFVVLTDMVQEVRMGLNDTGVEPLPLWAGWFDDLGRFPRLVNIFLDRPFLVSVHHTETHVPVLLGVIWNPPQTFEPEPYATT